MRRPARLPSLLALWGGLAAVKLILQLAYATRYGYFRDELYYLASTRHLALGYVEHPPLSIWILALQRAIGGEGLVALRFLPAVAGAAKLVAIGLLVRLLGGGTLATAIAMVAALGAPEYLGTDHLYSMNTWDQLLWVIAAGWLVHTLRTRRDRDWLLLGLLLGAGLMNKISVLWLGAGILAGLLLTPHRTCLRTRGPYLAAMVAGLLFTPYVAWQASHGWPLGEFMHNARTLKMVPTSPLALLGGLALTMNPVTVPIALAGLGFLMFGSSARPHRHLGWIVLTVVVIVAASRTSRPSYVALGYPLILAPGALVVAGWLRGRTALAGAVLAALGVSGALLAPFALPILSPDAFLRYQAAAGVKPPASERGTRAELPQHFADCFGWDEFAAAASRAYSSLAPEEQARSVIYGQNYGEAGAIDVLGRKYGLPPAISGHNSYWIWGPGPGEPLVVLVFGGEEEALQAVFDSVAAVDTVRCPRCMPYERDRQVWVCRGLRLPLRELWPRLKRYI